MKCIDYFLSQEVFELVFQEEIKAYRTSPVPHDLGRYYRSQEYFSHSNTGQTLAARVYAVAKFFRNRSKWRAVLSHYDGGSEALKLSVLDFGSGDNSFVFSAPSNVSAKGYDPFTGQNTQNHLGSLETLVSQDVSFDAITLWHSLEHTTDPLDTLRKLVDMLKPGGCLHIAVPNYSSWDAKHYKNFWAGYDVPRHLWHFSSESFGPVSEQLGLALIDQQPHWFDAFYVSYLSEKYKGSAAPLLRGALRTFAAVLSKKAFRNPSATYAVLKKPF